MLNLYQSNDMTVLAKLFCDQHQPKEDPFRPVAVIIQSHGMGQWLKLRAAEHHGIAANIECILPAAFLWRLYRQFLPAATPFKDSPFAQTHMAWRLMRILKTETDLPGTLNNYLRHTGDKDLRAFQLSNEIAGLFDQYLMYRPKMMLDWQQNKGSVASNSPEEWQQRLWRVLLADVAQEKPSSENLHRAALHLQLMQLLTKDDAAHKNSHLPSRLAVFGLSSMPSLQLDTLSALARPGAPQEMDIDIFFLNPCQHYWGDIASPQDTARRSIRSLLPASRETPQVLEDEHYLEVGNPILSSFGKQGREFFEMLLEQDHIQSQEYFIPPSGDTRLDFVKRDILELEYGGAVASHCPPTQREMNDQSIQLHGCHSRQREVEVLHDRILHMLRDNPDIKLNDMLVMVPDIGDYAPLVQTIFGAPLTYRIVDGKPTDQSVLLTTFMQLLKLPLSRFTGADILDLLTSPALARKFSLSKEDLELIRYWIMNTRIGWEIDGASKAAHWDLPADNRNTWRFGLDRLLAGFAKPEDSGIWQGILPFDLAPGREALVGILCHVIEQLNHYRQAFETPRRLAEWHLLLGEMLGVFFLPREEEILDVNAIHTCLEQMHQDTEDSRYSEVISLDLLRYLLNKTLADQPPGAGFIAGGITFATLMPMRSIPFRVVCLLGMNDGDYPRSDKSNRSYDCMAKQRQKGDRSGKLDDQYLFLEALLSAQDIFYLSYVSRGIRDDQPRPPSVVVTEWQVYLESIFTDFSLQEYPLQPFSPRHYQEHALRSFSDTWGSALQAAHQQQEASAAASATTASSATNAFALKPLQPNNALSCTSQQQLERFFRNSGKYFLQEGLQVYLEEDAAGLRDSEPFELDNLEKYGLGDEALQGLCRQEGRQEGRQEDSIEGKATWEAQVLASGRIMSGPLGKQQLDTAIRQARLVFEARQTYTQRAQQPPVPGTLIINGQELHYEIGESWEGHLLSCHVGQYRARYLLSAWIRHLFAGAAGYEMTSHCIALNSGKTKVQAASLAPLDPDTSIEHLNYLLSLYQEGITRPLLLAPETCRTWYETTQGTQTAALARDKATQAWEKETQYDSYWCRLFELPEAMGDEFQDMAQGVWEPLLKNTSESKK